MGIAGGDFQGAVGAAGNLVLVFRNFHGPVFSTAFGSAADQVRAIVESTPHRSRCSWIVTVWPARVWRQRHLSICHQRSLIATVLSLLTTRSV